MIQHQIPTAKPGLAVSSEFGNATSRKNNPELINKAFMYFTRYDNTLPPDRKAIFLDGSYFPETGETGSGSVWVIGRKIVRSFSWPISTNGSNILGELCALLLVVELLFSLNTTNETIYIYSDCAFVVNMFTGWSQPKDNIDLVDRVRELLKKLQTDRNVTIILCWTPAHVGVLYNEIADRLAVQGAKEAQSVEDAIPDFNKWYGISYGTAKRAITIAVKKHTQAFWNTLNTTLVKYKSTMQPQPYTDLGTAQQIRWRTQMVLGCDELNATRHRFGRGARNSKCPHCIQSDETVKHFLIDCPLYTQVRQPLRQVYNRIYAGYEQYFNDESILAEPVGRENTEKHKPVIEALNSYLSEAFGIRQQCLRVQRAM